MAVNLICTACKKTHKLKTRTCTCGHSNFSYKVRVKLPDGRWKTKQVDDLRLARSIEAKFKVKVIQGEIFDLFESPVIDLVWEKYLEWAKVHKRSWKDDQSRWNLYLKPVLSGQKMDRIKTKKVQDLLDQLSQSKTRRGVKFAPATVKQVLALLRRIYNWSITKELYRGGNPCDKVELEAFDNKVIKSLSKVEIGKLLTTLNEYPVEVVSLAIKFSLFTGRRRGEVLGLTWNMVDLDSRFVVSPGSNTKNKKTQGYPLNDSCVEILSRAKELNPPQSPDDLVFPSPSGKNQYYWIDGHWRDIKSKAEISIRYHDLRHCYASLLASSGEVDIYHLKELLGHRSLSMTQRYAHLFPESMRKATSVADRLFEMAQE